MIIYKATNLANGKVYIGATTLSLETRKRDHIRFAFRKDRPNGSFQDAILEYGPSNFAFEEIDHAETKDEMYDKEAYWISEYRSTDPNYGYNLDSGGIYCKKADSTKEKIGRKTKERWCNNDIALRMLNGLRKGTETWQGICKSRRVKFECPVCGKILYLQPYRAQSKKYCSYACAKEAGEYRNSSKLGYERAAELSHNLNLERKVDIGCDIIDWAFDNKEYVMRCKYNDVTNHYKPLTDFLYEKYGIFDLRSVYICLGVDNKRDFAKSLKRIVSEENIC